YEKNIGYELNETYYHRIDKDQRYIIQKSKWYRNPTSDIGVSAHIGLLSTEIKNGDDDWTKYQDLIEAGMSENRPMWSITSLGDNSKMSAINQADEVEELENEETAYVRPTMYLDP